MKKIIALLLAGFISVMVGVSPAFAGGKGKGHDPITICHATGSAKNPYVTITVDKNSVDFEGHGHHKKDIIPAPAGGCPVGESTPTPSPSPSVPTETPTSTPTEQPTEQPSETPSETPTETPTGTPTTEPTDEPTEDNPALRVTEERRTEFHQSCAGTVIFGFVREVYQAFNEDTQTWETYATGPWVYEYVRPIKSVPGCEPNLPEPPEFGQVSKPHKHVKANTPVEKVTAVPTAVDAGVKELPNTGGTNAGLIALGITLILGGAILLLTRVDKGKHTL